MGNDGELRSNPTEFDNLEELGEKESIVEQSSRLRDEDKLS